MTTDALLSIDALFEMCLDQFETDVLAKIRAAQRQRGGMKLHRRLLLARLLRRNRASPPH
jgi:hypothetical protein